MVTALFALMKHLESKGHKFSNNHIYAGIIFGLLFDFWIAFHISQMINN